MKNALKVLGIIAIAAIIGFAMIACNSDAGTDGPGGGGTGGGGEGSGPIYGGRGGGGWGGGGASGKTKSGTNLIVMDQATVNTNLVGYDPETKTLTFNNLPAKEMPVTGDIIVSGPSPNAPHGFLYTVDTVTTSDGRTVVTTKPASIEEAVQNANVKEVFPMAFEGGEVLFQDSGVNVEYIKPPVPAKSASRSVQQDEGDEAEDSHVTSIKFDIPEKELGEVTISGSIELSVEIRFDMDAKWYSMNRFQISAEPRLQASVEAKFEKEGSKDWKYKIFHQKFAPITIMAGPVPIVFVPELALECVVSVEGKVEVTAELLSWDYSYEFGLEYAKGQGLKGFNKNTSAPHPAKTLDGAQIEMSGEAKVEPKLEFMFGLYDCGWAGLSVGFYTSLQGEAGAFVGKNPNAKMELSLHCGLELAAEAKLEVLTFTLAEMDPWVFWDHDWTIWKRTFIYIQELTTDGNSSIGTTKLTLKLSQEIEGLSANDITIKVKEGYQGYVSKGTLSNEGQVYTLPITISNATAAGGIMEVAVAKKDYFIMPWKKEAGFYFIPVTSLSLNETSISLSVGETKPLVATVAPPNATNKNVSYSFNYGSSFVTIGDGVVTGKAVGSAMIVFTTSDGSKTATCTVNVTGSGGGSGVPVTGVTLNKTSITLSVGGTEQLIPTVAPSNATNQSVSWSSSNPGIATVSQNGTVTGVSVGESATITVTTNDGSKTASCSVTVTGSGGGSVPVTGVTLNPTTLSLTVNQTATLTATVAPSNASNKAVTWSTSNRSVASVSDGTVTGVSAGNATITVTTRDGGITATCAVTVTGSGGGTGITWHPVNVDSIFNTSATNTIKSIVWGNDKFVATGGFKIAYSSDGINWTVGSGNPATNGGGFAVEHLSAWGNNKFVVGENGYYSSDGITWNWRPDDYDETAIQDFYAITFGNGKFVAGGRTREGKTTLAYSTDGINWTNIGTDLFDGSNSSTTAVTAIAYGNNKYIVVANGQLWAQSPDGINWTRITSFTAPIPSGTSKIIYANNKFVAVGDRENRTGPNYKNIAYSSDGVNWDLASSEYPEQLNSIVWANNKFFAVGYDTSKITYSSDGVNWEIVTTNHSTHLNDVAWGNNRFVAVGTDGKLGYFTDN